MLLGTGINDLCFVTCCKKVTSVNDSLEAAGPTTEQTVPGTYRRLRVAAPTTLQKSEPWKSNTFCPMCWTKSCPSGPFSTYEYPSAALVPLQTYVRSTNAYFLTSLSHRRRTDGLIDDSSERQRTRLDDQSFCLAVWDERIFPARLMGEQTQSEGRREPFKVSY